MTVVDFRRPPPPSPPDPHYSGAALCLACGHHWVAVARAGAYEFPCPSCTADRGVWAGPLGTYKDAQVYTCTVAGCGSQHMLICRRPSGYVIMCAKCGFDHTINQVFPP